ARERVSQDVPFVDDGLALLVVVLGIGHGGVRVSLAALSSRQRLVDLDRWAAFAGRLDDAPRLIAEAFGEVAMTGLHLVVRLVVLDLARLMRRDFGGPCAMIAASFQVVLDLLAARTGGVEILATVALNLRLSAAAALDVVAQILEPRAEFRTIDGRRKLLAP